MLRCFFTGVLGVCAQEPATVLYNTTRLCCTFSGVRFVRSDQVMRIKEVMSSLSQFCLIMDLFQTCHLDISSLEVTAQRIGKKGSIRAKLGQLLHFDTSSPTGSSSSKCVNAEETGMIQMISSLFP